MEKRQSLLYIVIATGLMVLLFLSTWIYTYNHRLAFLDDDFGQWTAKSQLIKNCDLGSTVVIGDSRASASYIPQLAGIPGVNLAMTGSTPVESYFELKAILKCPRPPTTFILAFSPRQFEDLDWYWKHGASYGELNFDDLQDVAINAKAVHNKYLYNSVFGSEPPPTIKNWLYAKHFPPYDFASLIGAHWNGRLNNNLKVVKQTLAHGGQHVIGKPGSCATQPAWEATQASFTSDPLVNLYLEQSIILLEQHHAKILLASPPFSQLSIGRFNQIFELQYAAFIASLVGHHPDIQVVGPLFRAMPDCAFGDAHHLNQTGAEQFSRLIRPEFAAAMIASPQQPKRRQQ